MLINDEWMQYNYSCTIQEFLQMNFDEWVARHYNSTVELLAERFRIMCEPRPNETKEQCASRQLGYVRQRYTEAHDLIHLQLMDLDFDDWLEAYHLPAERLKEVAQATGTAREQVEYLKWYVERYQFEQETKRQMRQFYKQEELEQC